MRVLYTFACGDAQIEFGCPENAAELREMFEFRHRHYKSLGYLQSDASSDKDRFDTPGRSIHVIAKSNPAGLVGCLRIILGPELKVTDDFRFASPKEMAGIRPEKTVDIGRLISEGGKWGFPPHAVTAGLVLSAVLLGRSLDLRAGYAVVWRGLIDRLRRAGVRVHEVEGATLVFETGPFAPYYFAVFRGQCSVIWFLRDEVEKQLAESEVDRLFQKRCLEASVPQKGLPWKYCEP